MCPGSSEARINDASRPEWGSEHLPPVGAHLLASLYVEEVYDDDVQDDG